MAKAKIQDNALVIEMEGLDRLWALKSRLEIPLAHVRGATSDPGMMAERKGWKVGGSRVPAVITAGTFVEDGEWVFWDVHDRSRAVVVELADERYARLVVEVDDPRATVAMIEAATRGR